MLMKGNIQLFAIIVRYVGLLLAIYFKLNYTNSFMHENIFACLFSVHNISLQVINKYVLHDRWWENHLSKHSLIKHTIVHDEINLLHYDSFIFVFELKQWKAWGDANKK